MIAGRQRLLSATAVTVALGIAIFTFLGYAFGRGQSLAELARIYRDQNLRHYTLDSGALVVEFGLMGGDLKPLIRLPDGTGLVDFSDWDYNSTAIVDGQRFELVRLIPTATADYAAQRIVAGLNSGDWLLSREVTLDGGSAEIRFTFLAQKPVREARVTIAHSNWYYFEVRPRVDGFTGTVARASRADVEAGLIRDPSYEVHVATAPLGSAESRPARLGVSTQFGIQSVLTEYVVRDPPVGEYVPFAVEKVTASPVER